MKNKRLFIILSIALALLLIPIISMQFTDEVNWSLFDFVVAVVLLFGTALMYEIIMRKVKKRKLRIFIILVLLILVLLAWAELAVGIFGSPLAGS